MLYMPNTHYQPDSPQPSLGSAPCQCLCSSFLLLSSPLTQILNPSQHCKPFLDSSTGDTTPIVSRLLPPTLPSFLRKFLIFLHRPPHTWTWHFLHPGPSLVSKHLKPSHHTPLLLPSMALYYVVAIKVKSSCQFRRLQPLAPAPGFILHRPIAPQAGASDR
jgi:hypothetical protein